MIKSNDVVNKNERADCMNEIKTFPNAINEYGAEVVAYLDWVQYPGLAVGVLCT